MSVSSVEVSIGYVIRCVCVFGAVGTALELVAQRP